MSAGPASALGEAQARSPQIASSAVVVGTARLGEGSLLAEGSGLAACTATTLRMYAARKGWDLTTIDVDVRYDIADDGRGATKRTITVPVDLPPDHRKRLADLAERTPVTLAIRVGTPITTTLEPRRSA